ncbi:MAG: arylsulfotransferase family protein [Blastopirellula sp. JB062]
MRLSRTLALGRRQTVSVETGEVLRRDHIIDILARNGYEALVYGLTNRRDVGDPVHMNDAQPVLAERAGIAKRGDIAISLRNISTVFLYRPSTGEIVWLRTGPWISQHDVDVLADGRLHVHSNNSFPKASKRLRPFSDVYVIDPQTDEIERPYHDVLTDVEAFNLAEGLSRILPNEDLFFEQTNSGWIFRAAKDRLRWEFVNQTRPDFVGRVNWSRYFAPDEISLDWLNTNEGEENERN